MAAVVLVLFTFIGIWRSACVLSAAETLQDANPTMQALMARLETLALTQELVIKQLQVENERWKVVKNQLETETERWEARFQSQKQQLDRLAADKEAEQQEFQELKAECAGMKMFLRDFTASVKHGVDSVKSDSVTNTKSENLAPDSVTNTESENLASDSVTNTESVNPAPATDTAKSWTPAPVTAKPNPSSRPAAISPHALSPRADDTSPLEPVVTQLSQRVGQMGAEVEALKAERVQQVKAIQDAASSVYIRWGSSGCPHSAQLVYQGVVGGSEYSETGAAANFLCLSLNPVPGTPQPQAALADLYGAEYESRDTHHDKDPVCAVCRSQRPTVIMIPGTNQCLPGWTTEYSGYLMAGHKTHPAATEFICVDSQMESRLGGDPGQDGKLLYFTEVACGSLPCQPYVNHAIVTCAVCSM